VRRIGHPNLDDLGRHANDRMVSFYCVSPSGPNVEYGWDGRRIDDRVHTISYYEEGNVWGHRRKPAGE